MRTFQISVSVMCCVVAMSLGASAAELLTELQGPTEILFGPVYTYSVLVQGEYDAVAWSATGGTVKREWWEGSRYFCEVQWYENKAEDPANIKVYGQKKGSDTEIAERLHVTLQAKKRSLDFRSLQNAGGKCLEVKLEDLVKNGGKVQISECNGSIQQRWKLDEFGRLVNEGGKCLDIHLPDLITNGGKVQVWECARDVAQQTWRMTDTGALLNVGGKCLDVHVDDLNKDGGKVQIWECSDVIQQQWKWID